jgi:hypothetical protein
MAVTSIKDYRQRLRKDPQSLLNALQHLVPAPGCQFDAFPIWRGKQLDILLMLHIGHCDVYVVSS